MISAIKTAISTPHPTRASGLRQPGVGSGSGSGGYPPPAGWPYPPPPGP